MRTTIQVLLKVQRTNSDRTQMEQTGGIQSAGFHAMEAAGTDTAFKFLKDLIYDLLDARIR